MSTRERTPGVERLRRSSHFVPGANDKMLQKSLDSNADSLILDLEDAVTPDMKDDARLVVTRWLQQAEFGHKERVVRMNALDTPWALKDLEITMQGAPDAYLVPKVSTLDELHLIDEQISKWEAQYNLPVHQTGLLLVASETPRAALNLPTFPECQRVVGMTWGAEDLSAALGAKRNRDEQGRYLSVFEHCRNMVLLSAAAGGVQPMDGVYVDFKDSSGLARECEEAAWMGFTGKITIHPNQIDIVNAAFSPSEEDVARAQRLLEAFEEAETQGLMAISFEGQMVDVPHQKQAEKLLERAAFIKANET